MPAPKRPWTWQEKLERNERLVLVIQGHLVGLRAALKNTEKGLARRLRSIEKLKANIAAQAAGQTTPGTLRLRSGKGRE